jgi:hypothetical protein
MKYSCHVYNNFIWFWYDLIRTNPDWRCFQQNYRGVVICAEIKVLRIGRNFLTIFLDQKRPSKLHGRTRSLTRSPQGNTERPGGSCAVALWGPRSSFSRDSNAENPINRETPRNKPRTLTPLPQASVPKKYDLEPCFGTLPNGGIIIGGHLHHPGGLHDEEGVVHPQGWGYVLVAMCLISLSLVFLIWHDLDVPWALLI